MTVMVKTVLLFTGEGRQEFTLEPENQSVVQGEVVILKCVIKNRVGTVQWTRGGFGLGYERSLPGFERCSMIGGNYSIGGRYQCWTLCQINYAKSLQ